MVVVILTHPAFRCSVYSIIGVFAGGSSDGGAELSFSQ